MKASVLRKLIQIGSVLAGMLILILCTVLLVQTVKIKVAKQRIADLTAAIQTINAERQSIEDEIEYYKSQSYIESYARQYLDMQKDNEYHYVPED